MVQTVVFDAFLWEGFLSTIETKWLGVVEWACGCPGPLASIQHLVIAWAITCQTSCMVKGLAAKCANLPTQVPTHVSVNVASLTSPKLRPSPRDHLP